MSGAAADDAFVGEFALIMAVALIIYVVPTVIAFARHHPNRYAIMVVNLVAGGTGIGWLGTLVWAFGAVHLPSDSGASGLPRNKEETGPVRLAIAPGPEDDGHFAAGAPLSTAAAVVEIERLGRLRAGGHLSEAEYARLKRAVLDRMLAVSGR